MEYQIEEHPLVSVLLAVSNNGNYLPECIQSLLFQNYTNIEIIAIDDNSKDNSMQVLRAFHAEDKRLKIYRNVKKYGLAVTLNRAMKRAKGKFIVFMDTKDTITANKIGKQVDFLLKNPKVVAVGTQCLYVDSTGKRIGKSNFPAVHAHISQIPLHGVSVLIEGMMINKYRIPRDLLHFPVNRPFFLYSDMAIKLMHYGELANLPEFLHTHRKTGSILTSKTKEVLSRTKFWLATLLRHETPLPIGSVFTGVFR